MGGGLGRKTLGAVTSMSRSLCLCFSSRQTPRSADRFGTWLEEAGFDLLTCPGPVEPDYTCIGGRTGVCPLAAEASIVVLDMSLDSEAVVMGTAAEDLLGMYLLSGHRVVVLGSRGGEEIPGQLVRLRRHPRQDELLGAVLSLADAGEPHPGSVL